MAANRVEVERLRSRLRMISWRHHFGAKLGMVIMSRIADFGFNVSRTLALTAALVLICAINARIAFIRERLVAAEPADGAVSEGGFNALGYALDAVIPWLDLGLDARWVFSNAALAAGPSIFEIVNWGCIAIGWGLTTVIAAGIAMRAQAVFGRVQE